MVAYAAPTEESKAAPGTKAGRMTYKPMSYQEIVNDAARGVLAAIDAGNKRIEVEFPPVPTSLDSYKGSSDLFIDNNTQLALAGARQLAAAGRKVHLVLPDQGEYNRTSRIFKSSLELADGVTLGHLKEAEAPNPLSMLFNGGGAPEAKAAADRADTYILINASCGELPMVQAYVEKQSPGKVAILWNLELETLRGDLGLPAFPSKDVHLNFLSYFLPAFYLRPRDYSKSVTVAPFLVNYSGALFREYPGPWQVMLKQDDGVYACIAEDTARYNLGDVKEELMTAMGLNTEVEGSAMQVLRRGFKNSTWWEDTFEQEKSHMWRL